MQHFCAPHHAFVLTPPLNFAYRHWEGLSRFLDDGPLEIDSNPVEPSIHPTALNRKRDHTLDPVGSRLLIPDGGKKSAAAVEMAKLPTLPSQPGPVYSKQGRMPGTADDAKDKLHFFLPMQPHRQDVESPPPSVSDLLPASRFCRLLLKIAIAPNRVAIRLLFGCLCKAFFAQHPVSRSAVSPVVTMESGKQHR